MTTQRASPKAERRHDARLVGWGVCALTLASAWAVFAGVRGLSLAFAAVALVVLAAAALMLRPRARAGVFFESDLPASYFEGASELARQVATSDVRVPLAITRADIDALAESPEFARLHRAILERAKTVPQRSPESLAAIVGDDKSPDTYHIRPGGIPRDNPEIERPVAGR